MLKSGIIDATRASAGATNARRASGATDATRADAHGPAAFPAIAAFPGVAAPRDRGGLPASLSPALVARALENLVAERQSDGSAGVAVEQLCAALIDERPGATQAYVERLRDCGVSIEALYDTFIPRAAARLGEMWVDDTLGFAGVTLGMARLTEVFRRLSPDFLKARQVLPRARRALFALAPGECHSLGVVMAADQFQRRGWTVRVELRSGPADLAQIVGGGGFDLVGLSAGARRAIPILAETVAALRGVAAPGTPIVVGGHVAALDPEVAGRVGADLASSAALRAAVDIVRNV